MSQDWSHERRQVGPGSLLWHYAGDRRLGLTGLSAGLLQLMHPAVGAGVAGHSNFFDDPWDRVLRSMPQILGVVYDPEPEVTGRRIRDLHRSIRGVDDSGRPYRALQPSTFWWAHATFQHAVEQVADRFDGRRFGPPEREELYQDGVEWYRRYGVPMKPVPPDYRSFVAEWDRHIEEVLELTPAAERALDLALNDRTMRLPFLPWWTRLAQPVLVTPVLRLTAIGGLPGRLRRRFGIPWRFDEQVEYGLLQVAVREMWRGLPAALRYGPTAQAGWRAHRRAGYELREARAA